MALPVSPRPSKASYHIIIERPFAIIELPFVSLEFQCTFSSLTPTTPELWKESREEAGSDSRRNVLVLGEGYLLSGSVLPV